MTSNINQFDSHEDPVKEATISTLQRILSPLLELMFDTGLTVQDLNKVARVAAVRVAARRIIKDGGHGSKSRIAIMTGLPRSEVAKFLRSTNAVGDAKPNQPPARRVLAGWHDTPTFLAPDGSPAILPIFGNRRSFEKLVEKFGGGIPVRAMLDELTQLNAIERLSNQRIRAKSRLPILTGLNSRSIEAIGDRAGDLLETLVHNLRRNDHPFFEGTATLDAIDSEMVNLLKREIADQGANFINSAHLLLRRSQRRRAPKKGSETSNFCRLGVTVFYFQDQPSKSNDSLNAHDGTRRRNLRRRQIRKAKEPDVNRTRE